MIELKNTHCTKECPFYLDHGTDSCNIEHHLYGANRVVPAPIGEKCTHYGKKIPRKAFPLMLDFDRIRARQSGLEN